MDVDDIVFQIKRKGTFDELRKQLYNDVLNDQLGKAFIERVNEYANQALERDPSLSTKSSAAFQATIMNELER
ncbi:hypothetical protein VTP01DRAFT_3114 [Rhizomucor pusillus]|uniref:uncharacterized protein n=1 Tax=Rhizomucor pusillus TaxID=4840 RepID=UPI0037443C37